MKKKKIDLEKLPVYDIFLKEDDGLGVQLVSIVDEPAIKVKGYAFADAKPMKFAVDKEKQIIVGPVMIPNMKIYREDEEHGPHYVNFPVHIIQLLVYKLNKNGSNRKINFNHTNRMVDAFSLEDWTIEDKVYDKSKIYGFDLPVGTYMMMVKVEDKEFWDVEVKENGFTGFSIEGILSQKLVQMSEILEEEEDETDPLGLGKLTEDELKDIYDFLKNN